MVLGYLSHLYFIACLQNTLNFISQYKKGELKSCWIQSKELDHIQTYGSGFNTSFKRLGLCDSFDKIW